MNLVKLRSILSESHDKVPFILLTLTCNVTGGQPVSMENIKAVKLLADEYKKPILIDSARFAETAWFIQDREPGYEGIGIREITRQIYNLADAMLMSAKKDGLVNIGGFMATRHQTWFAAASEYVILFEGFTTYGGLAGRDLSALAIGLTEVISLDYLSTRIRQIERFGRTLRDANIPIQHPVGGHAILIDAGAFLPHVPREEYIA
ncbi:Tryptophanase [Penicillium macrosclerotiorum]|uniref:Tryptophanase n=1 Tax=Penicillium macrosclerotiorum TaxID=303699 RepID=UPI0025483CD2|nr:Tryptophanase [Penicillium macrosclerotiorum]KAJ5679791.1 Tryptophanase [Penicillium macrosclerotiorum]